MCVDGCVTRSARQVLVLTIGNVLVCSCITVFLGQTKVNDVDQVAFLSQAHQKVIRLHISVNEVLGVDVLNAADLRKARFTKKTLKVVLLQQTIFYSSTWFCIIPSDQPTAGQSSGWTSWSRNWRDPPDWGRATPSPSRYNLLLHHTTL